MNFDEQLDRYADLLVNVGLNIQPGQMLSISAAPEHRELATRIADAAYRKGARYVDLALHDSRVFRSRILHSSDADLAFVPKFISAHLDQMIDDQCAALRLVGPEDPDLMADLPAAKLSAVARHASAARKRYLDEGIGKSQVHWCVAAAATQGWAEKVFPSLSPNAALDQLWDAIFRICRVQEDDPVAAWQTHLANLNRRMETLQAMNIEALHFVGPGTDLRVGLSARSKWLGGSIRGPHGANFIPNFPTEEVFTTPDWRQTCGTVRTTRPFLLHGKRVEDLQMVFEDGIIQSFEAKQGTEIFQAHIDTDEGARRLGEVALVGTDSPIYETGLLFQAILYDENAACHIATGNAYKNAVVGGESLSSEELDGLGCNESITHTDMMISSVDVDVLGELDGNEVPLLKNGRWVV
jgi:aminopeptidase